MEKEVFIEKGLGVLEGATHFRLVKFSPESPAAVLQAVDGEGSLLLGDMGRIAPDAPVTEAEASMLGCAAEAVQAFCRVRIPKDRPMDAGFDTSSLILLDSLSGQAVEAERPGAPMLPLKR